MMPAALAATCGSAALRPDDRQKEACHREEQQQTGERSAHEQRGLYYVTRLCDFIRVSGSCQLIVKRGAGARGFLWRDLGDRAIV